MVSGTFPDGSLVDCKRMTATQNTDCLQQRCKWQFIGFLDMMDLWTHSKDSAYT